MWEALLPSFPFQNLIFVELMVGNREEANTLIDEGRAAFAGTEPYVEAALPLSAGTYPRCCVGTTMHASRLNGRSSSRVQPGANPFSFTDSHPWRGRSNAGIPPRRWRASTSSSR